MSDPVLTATELESLISHAQPTLGTLPEWFVIGGHCPRCERNAWIDRWELERQFGRNRYISQLRKALRCRKCGNKGSNSWIMGKLPR